MLIKYYLPIHIEILKKYMRSIIFVCIFRYKIDETNPEASLEEALFDEEGGYTYEIISKMMPQRKAQPLSQNGANTAAAAVKT